MTLQLIQALLFFFFFFFFESAFVTRSMYVGTKTRAGAEAARLLGVIQS